MRGWLRSSDGWITAAGAIVVCAAAWQLEVGDAKVLAAFAAFILISELFEVTLPNGTPTSLGLAPALGYALLADSTVAGAVVVFAVGAASASVVRALFRRDLRIARSATHLLVVAGAAGAYNAVAGIDSLPTLSRSGISPVGIAVMLGVVLAIDTAARTLRSLEADPGPPLPVLKGALRSGGALQLSIVSTGALLALSWPSLSYWSFPLFLAPLAATQFAFRQLAEIRKTYLQTIRALSKVPEMAGYTNPGHSTRVAELSVAIGRELGLSEDEQQQVEYAALLHDIGRVSLADPSDSVETAKMELALVGAQIVRETGHFPMVSEMIEHQHEPYRRRGEETNRDLPWGAKIIKVASSYDDVTRPGGPALSALDALERLHLGMTYDYDPQVIQALTRVLEKRSAI